ncbi:MAG: molybdopterin-dependent oxidoreductase [Acidobacteriota bacterium]|nr:molybdopterin-dependent oxidoreductase [Acidobacteriota bacterium]
MSRMSRRTLLKGGVAAAAGVSGLSVAARLAARYGLVPPDGSGLYGPGQTLTYAAQRLLVGDSPAREFPRHLISPAPFANETLPPGEMFTQLQAGGFADWRLDVGGMVQRPLSLSLPDLRRLPQRSHITQLACEEGWSYIAEWTGTALADVLAAAGMRPGARYVAYYSTDPESWETIDIAEALHPQTLVAWGMNGADLPVGFGGPLRLRVPRQLGYKSVKYVVRVDVVDDVSNIGKGLGGANPEYGYAWYAGI